MTGQALSRAECQRLSGLVRLGLKTGLFGVQYEDFLAIADLVESYALPPEDGERPTGDRLLGSLPKITDPVLCAALAEAAGEEPPAPPPGDGERADLAEACEEAAEEVSIVPQDEYAGAAWLAQRKKEARELSAKLRRAAALLRQPPPPPAAGVSKQAVLDAISEPFYRRGACTVCGRIRRGGHEHRCAVANALADVEALPEAAPAAPAWVDYSPDDREARCTGVAASWCPKCGTCTCPREQAETDDKFEDPNCPLHGPASPHAEGAAAPPSGVDPEAVLAAIAEERAALPAVDDGLIVEKMLQQVCDLIAARVRALLEAKPLTPGPPTSTLPT